MKQVLEKECCTPGVRSGRLQAGKPVGGCANESWKSRCIPVGGGETLVGTRDPKLPQDGEGPPRKVRLKPFFVDPYCVTNEWFAEFVDSTGYVQPTKNELRAVRGENSIYHNNGIQTWHVRANGEAENVEIS